MTKALISREYVSDIAEAIRLKRGTSDGTDTDVVLSVFGASVEQYDENTAMIEITDANGTTRALVRPSVEGNFIPYDMIEELTPYGDVPSDYYQPVLVDDVRF